MKNQQKYLIQSEAGLLVIFPCYFWRSTIQFTRDRDRIYISFS
ncbi:MAG: hypothetical protein F6K18_08835 [Okeania sp. SIO2C2]|nr:putative 2OG-Fe(II) oxygenase [Okeania sp. SIO2C2]NEP86930.1 hypothetical protein [Okeania sp. SIO2C2]